MLFSENELKSMECRICDMPNCNCGKITLVSPPGVPRGIEVEINLFSQEVVDDEVSDIKRMLFDEFRDKLTDEDFELLSKRYLELKIAQAQENPNVSPGCFPDPENMVRAFVKIFPFDPMFELKIDGVRGVLGDTYITGTGGEHICILSAMPKEGRDVDLNRILYIDLSKPDPTFTSPDAAFARKAGRLLEEQIPGLFEELKSRYDRVRAVFDQWLENGAPQGDDEDDFDFDDDDDDDDDDFDEDDFDFDDDDFDFDDDDFDEDDFDTQFVRIPAEELHPKLRCALPESMLPDKDGMVVLNIVWDNPPSPADRTRIVLTAESDGSRFEWRVPSLRELFRGERQVTPFKGYPDEYTDFFVLLERNIVAYCQERGIMPTDRQLEEIFSALRRRPDGRRINELHDAAWQAAALMLGAFPCSQSEFEAILLRLEQTVRTFAMEPGSCHYIREAITLF